MATRQRPLSPHLQVYRWQVQMVTSILHRATGIVLTIGALLIAAALLALMLGPEAWQCVTGLAGSWFGLAFLFAWSWAFAYHLCNGIRHIVQDFGHGYRIASFVRSSWMSVIASLLVTGLIWGYVLAGGGV